MPRFMVTACATFVLAQVGIAQDSYRIRIHKDEKPGDKQRVVEVEKTTQKMLVTDSAGKVLNMKDEQPDRSQVYEQTILAKEAGKPPHKLSRKYEKVVVKEDGKDVEIPLNGKTVTIERKNGKYAFKLDDGELSEQMLRFLTESFKDESDQKDDFNDVFFSKEPVKVGQTWKCDAAAVIAELTSELAPGIDVNKASVTGKLNEVYQKDGRPFGRIDIDMNVPIKSVGKGARVLKAKPGSYLKSKLHFDACIDGAHLAGKLTGTMEISVSTEVPLPNKQTGTLKITITSNIDETRQELK